MYADYILCDICYPISTGRTTFLCAYKKRVLRTCQVQRYVYPSARRVLHGKFNALNTWLES